MTTAEVLRAARALIEDRSCWTRETMARYGNNHEAPDATDPRACRFCAIGAMERVLGGLRWDHPALKALRSASGETLRAHGRDDAYPSPADVNDYLGHEATLSMFDRAIAHAEQS